MTLDFILIHSVLAGVQSVGHVSFFTTSQIKFEKMGSHCSAYEPGSYHPYGRALYNTALGTCVMPDVSIDESLMKFSGVNSNTELQNYSDDLLNRVPDFINILGSALGGLTSVPNAVGFGALVISMIIDLVIKSSSQSQSETYSMIQRVFGEEKASSVRDTMVESVTRYQTFIDDKQLLLVEIGRLEKDLSKHLTILKDSLLFDNQMSSRGFKIWLNGAAFHVQMRIHEARLKVQAGRDTSNSVESIKITINLYLQDLERLLATYQTYKTSKTDLRIDKTCNCGGGDCVCVTYGCIIVDTEKYNCKVHHANREEACGDCHSQPAFIDNVFSKYEPITSLRNHFSHIKENVNASIHQQGTFTLPTKA